MQDQKEGRLSGIGIRAFSLGKRLPRRHFSKRALRAPEGWTPRGLLAYAIIMGSGVHRRWASATRQARAVGRASMVKRRAADVCWRWSDRKRGCRDSMFGIPRPKPAPALGCLRRIGQWEPFNPATPPPSRHEPQRFKLPLLNRRNPAAIRALRWIGLSSDGDVPHHGFCTDPDTDSSR